jgi:hypothetical protein
VESHRLLVRLRGPCLPWVRTLAPQPVLLNPTASQTISQPASTFLTVSGTTPFQVHTGAADQNLWVDSGSNAGGPSGAGTSLRSVNDAFNLVEPLTLQGNPILLNPAGSGNVGVGTTSPASALDVNGSINASQEISLEGPSGLKMNDITGASWLLTTGNSRLNFINDSAATVMVIGNTGSSFPGRVGIGTTGPGYTLDVNGDVNSSGVFRKGGTAGVSAGPFTSVSSITSSGGIVTALSGSSDERLKNVLHSFTRGLEDILKITPQVFTWNEEGQKRTGFKPIRNLRDSWRRMSRRQFQRPLKGLKAMKNI